MIATDKIDILLTLDPHGWSTCWIVVDRKPVELAITHILGNPYEDFIDALLRLLRGDRLVTFFWYAEPGGERIEIERIKERQHMLNVRIDGFYESYGEAITDFEPTLYVELKAHQFLTLAYFQLKKIAVLLKDPQFSKDRGRDFPFDRFKLFEKEVNEYLQLK